MDRFVQLISRDVQQKGDKTHKTQKMPSAAYVKRQCFLERRTMWNGETTSGRCWCPGPTDCAKRLQLIDQCHQLYVWYCLSVARILLLVSCGTTNLIVGQLWHEFHWPASQPAWSAFCLSLLWSGGVPGACAFVRKSGAVDSSSDEEIGDIFCWQGFACVQ